MEWLILALFAAALALAIRVRRAMRDPASPLGRWFRANMRPWLRDAAMAVFLVTVLGWVVLNAFAPEEGRKDLGQILREFWQPVGEGTAPPRPGVETDKRR